MKQFLYDATTQEKREKAHKEVGRKLQNLPEGYVYLITAKRNKAFRSNGQNALYHLYLTVYATAGGLYLDEVKRDFYDAIGFYTFRVDRSTGEEKARYKSSADLDSGQMKQLIDQLIQWGTMNYPEARLPVLGEADYSAWMEIENEYNKATAGW